MKRKRLFYDIETSFNIIADFSCGYNKIIRPNQIIKERQIICISYKWEDEYEVHPLDRDWETSAMMLKDVSMS